MASYSVELVENCRIVRGSLPIEDMLRLTTEAPEDSVICPDLADRFGATLVFGTRLDIERLRATAPSRKVEILPNVKLSEGAIKWLQNGERGASSDALFQHLTGYPALKKWIRHAPPHPHDPADLRRCLLMLEMAVRADRTLTHPAD